MGVWASQVLTPLLMSITYKNRSSFTGEDKTSLFHTHVKPIMVVFKNGKLTSLAMFFGSAPTLTFMRQ